jgi:hypothetical protein
VLSKCCIPFNNNLIKLSDFNLMLAGIVRQFMCLNDEESLYTGCLTAAAGHEVS